ncbi:hypothetical protein ABXT64_10925 [Candidatus Marifrigoribacter sp. Uisw_064]|jgi:hypothetical protein|uniref:hypothetical protein n=1 Tax=Candidatus Marifrigoribacter sp. Uisw_064 TaxID=3230970 RepID=UPI003D53AE08
MEHKIKIKIGSIEIEYEGNEEYLKNDLPNLIDKLIDLKGISIDKEEPEDEIEEETSSSGQNLKMSSNTIAAKLSSKSAADLVVVACAKLCLVDGSETFNRKDILTEMKTASNYYSKSAGKNLTQSLRTLISSQKLIERSTDNYALSAKLKGELKNKLGG